MDAKMYQKSCVLYPWMIGKLKPGSQTHISIKHNNPKSAGWVIQWVNEWWKNLEGNDLRLSIKLRMPNIENHHK